MKNHSLLQSVILSALMFAPSLAFSQSADDLKAQSLQICEAQAAQLPEEQKALTLKVCSCTADKTDFDQLLKDSQAGDFEKVQKDALAIALECQKDL